MYNLEHVKSRLQEIVKGREDFVYELPEDKNKCVYMNNGKPSCIIGHLFEADDLLDSKYDEDVNSGIMDVVNEYGLPYTDEAVVYMSAVQNAQDSGRTWGEVI